MKLVVYYLNRNIAFDLCILFLHHYFFSVVDAHAKCFYAAILEVHSEMGKFILNGRV